VVRPALLQPLRQRDFALLWFGMTISLLGDGIYFVAIAWQVYDLSDSPTSLSLVGLSWSIGMVACLLAGGVASDRFDRRLVMIGADTVRLVAVLAMGVLAVTGHVEVWQLIALSVLYGGAEAFFGPSFSALIPQIVPAVDLVQANAFQEVMRPATYRLAGPAIGGLLVAGFGAGTAFLVDAGTFMAAIACVAAIRSRHVPSPAAVRTSVAQEVREGLRFVRSQAWLWATLVAASVSLLVFWGPIEVLLPYIIRHDLHGPASTFGLVLAMAGLGGILASLVLSERGLPREKVRMMYLAWGLGLLPISGYALATATWQLMALGVLYGVGMSLGMVVWTTLMQTRVPPGLLGRVTSLDWLVSIGLTPISFALTGPIAAAVGSDATLIGAGLIGCLSTLALYVLVGDLRRDRALHEGGDVLGEGGIADVGGLHADDLDALARR
jgi:DHA3 family tetracycline resistance protein-like MFS transporter